MSDGRASRDDLDLLHMVMSDAELQIVDDGEGAWVYFHARGDGYTPFGTHVLRGQAERLRRLLEGDQ